MLKSNRILLLFLALLITLGWSTGPTQTASALSGSQWNAGNIIDDGAFYNGADMSVADIQNFLVSKVPICDTWGQKMYGTVTRAQYAASIGYSTPFVCLKDYYENPTTHENNLTGTMPSGALSGAQIIRLAAETYNINARALLVLLQKEQTLVTDDWPYWTQYRSATGYGCPDTSVCDSQYYGFYNQVMNAARQYRLYATYPSSYRYKPYQTNYILYNPNTACGGTNVYIQNSATAGLYNYTPYQPNQAALDNLYGTGDSCSAYGNRNFWRLYADWFGNLYMPYYASNAGQTAALTLPQGSSGVVSFRFKNSGTTIWKDDVSRGTDEPSVHLATSGPVNRPSNFSTSWPNPARPNLVFTKVYESDGTTLAADQHTVNPGQIAEYQVTITAPDTAAPGQYSEKFLVVRDGAINWNMQAEVETIVTVVNKFQATLLEHTSKNLAGFQNTRVGTENIRYLNSGTAIWKDDVSRTASEPSVHFATSGPVNRSSNFSATWPTKERPNLTFTKVYESDGTTLAADQHIVNPGQIAEYQVTMTVPDRLNWGIYEECFQIVADGYSWWDMGGKTCGTVQVHQSVFSTAQYTQSVYPLLAQGESSTSFIAFKNTGNAAWYDDSSAGIGIRPVHLATAMTVNRTSVSAYGWPTKERPNLTFTKVYESDGTTLAADQHIVNPGQIVEFEFGLKNYSILPGQYIREGFTPVLEGSYRWSMSTQQVWLDVIGK